MHGPCTILSRMSSAPGAVTPSISRAGNENRARVLRARRGRQECCRPLNDPRQQELRSRLEALGFDAVRFTTLGEAAPVPLQAWLNAGMHADMHWIERSAEKRLNPDLVLPGARS